MFLHFLQTSAKLLSWSPKLYCPSEYNDNIFKNRLQFFKHAMIHTGQQTIMQKKEGKEGQGKLISEQNS